MYIRNAVANWVTYGSSLVVMFLLSPFVVHSLGNEAYGVWCLVISLTGSMGLIEMGIRASLQRYINYYLARNDIARVNGVLNTAMVFFLWAGLALMLVSGGLAVFLGELFPKVGPGLAGSARTALLLVTLNLWLSLLGAGYLQVLSAFDRFDIFGGINTGVLLLQAGATVVALHFGSGLVGLACVLVAATMVRVVMAYGFAKRIFPPLVVRPSLATWPLFRQIFSFGVWSFIGSVGTQMVSSMALIVIAVFLGPTNVTFYAIALTVIQTARALMDQLYSVLFPQAMKASSVGDYRELRWLFLWACKLGMCLAIPLFVGMMVLGPELIRLWMGPQYNISGPILILLAFPQLFETVVRAGMGIICGLNKVRTFALLNLAQGVLSIGSATALLAATHWGLLGVAAAMAVPTVGFTALVARLILRWIQLPVGGVLYQELARWGLLSVLLGGLFVATMFLPWHDRWVYFGPKVLLLAMVSLGLAWYTLLTRSERDQMRKRVLGTPT